jgi:DNA polymerase-3 subunit epsilon
MPVIIDTETTGLLKPVLCSNDLQPRAIEVFMGKFSLDDFEIYEEISTLCIPVDKKGTQIPLEPHIIKITGIEDYMFRGKPTFADIIDDIVEFCKGETLIVGQNLMFDYDILFHNFLREDRAKDFPVFPDRHCTIEMAMPLCHKRLKLGVLYEMATGEQMKVSHRAKDDAVATLTVYKWLLEIGM